MNEEDNSDDDVTIRPEDLGEPGATTFSERDATETEDDSQTK